jgi:signal transduction histidine kinase
MVARGLRFAVEPCDAPAQALADHERVLQILLNLLSNAIKFTEARGGEAGAVRLACECGAAFPDGRPAVAIRVSDTGRGIAAGKVVSIFDPFVQVDRHLTQSSLQGVGLGLAISRELARAMGGDLTVESRPDEGSTFTLHLVRA